MRAGKLHCVPAGTPKIHQSFFFTDMLSLPGQLLQADPIGIDPDTTKRSH
jgi:hypothetical protein